MAEAARWVPLEVDDPDEAWQRGDPAEILGNVDEFLSLIVTRPEWQTLAACRGVGTDLFFLPHGGDADPARTLCDRCPVSAECHDYAAAHGPELQGIWAGHTQSARRRWQRPAPRPVVIACEHCGARFEHTGRALYCSSNCRRNASYARRRTA